MAWLALSEESKERIARVIDFSRVAWLPPFDHLPGLHTKQPSTKLDQTLLSTCAIDDSSHDDLYRHEGLWSVQ
ncbi:hypothetical protein Slin14017_G049490 [Septoria linicola]|nr:hypothetical protein Slin14017_G049490 [Septoria linicola]